MKCQNENTVGSKLTVFKPPAYIYKLSKNHMKNNQKLAYQFYCNKQFSLRKYPQTINLSNQSQLLLYEWRKQSVSPILKIVYIELLQKSTSNLSSENNFIDVNIYSEHIEKVLADMINLTLNEALYVLNECILAYREVFQKYSAVSINKFYIGLNSQGKIKVWINQDYSQNQIQTSTSESQSVQNQTLIVQTAIVNKIIHMISLLSNSNCKFFFYGLEKQLIIKRFLFNNCLQYIHNFVANTNNFLIPDNLSYMLPKKNSFFLQKSAVRFNGNAPKAKFNSKLNNVDKQRKISENLSFSNISTFKHFGSFVRTNQRQQTECILKSCNKQRDFNQIRSKRFSQNISKDAISSLFVPKTIQKFTTSEIQNTEKKQNKISLHVIIQKTRNRKTSIKSNNILTAKKSNSSIPKTRPSICIPPTFLTKSKKYQSKQNQPLQSLESQRKTQKSYSLQSSKSKDYHSLLGSKVSPSKNDCRFAQFKTSGGLIVRDQSPKISLQNTKKNLNVSCKQNFFSNIRSRSASANIKFGSYKFPYHMLDQNKRKHQNHQFSQVLSKQNKMSLQKNSTFKNQTDKVSTNSISNDGTAKKRSFLTKTNYDSITQDNDKNFSTSRMNFSSMSIENRITNKNFDNDMTNSQKQDVKRSLMSFKYGFEQILQNPSCKQVQQQNESKSYNGSSLRNTQNISDAIPKNPRKNDETCSNNYSFGNSSNRQRNRLNLNDSTEENWNLIKQKNEQVLMKNQWKKTIHNLQIQNLQDVVLNQSIVDACDQIIERDHYPDVRLQKLDRLGKNMCYSIVNKCEQSVFASVVSSKKKLNQNQMGNQYQNKQSQN